MNGREFGEFERLNRSVGEKSPCRVGPGNFTPSRSQARKSRSSCRNTYRFDSVAKRSQCPDHSRSAGSLSLFTYCGPAFLIANAVVQDYPDQLTEAIRNCADGFVVS